MAQTWLSLKEASDMTGKSVNALRILVNRKRFDMVKKAEGNGGAHWLIHRDSLLKTCGRDEPATGACQGHATGHDMVNTVTLEYYEQQRKEWLKERDELQMGMMTYRWQFEQLDRQVKLLPCPAEEAAAKLRALQEEQDRRSMPWWKRMFRK